MAARSARMNRWVNILGIVFPVLFSACSIGTSDETRPNDDITLATLDENAGQDGEAMAQLSDDGMNPDIQSNVTSNEEGVDPVLAALSVPEVLVNQTPSQFGLQVEKGQGYANVRIQSDGQLPAYTVTQLTQPDRLVVDFKAPIGRLNRVFDIAGTNVLSRVRLGAHTDKTRLVLDIPANQTVEHRVMDGANQVTVQIAAQGSSPVDSVETMGSTEPLAAPDREVLNQNIPSDEMSVAEVVESEQQIDEIENVAAAPAAPKEVPASTRLVSLVIESAGDKDNLLVAELSNTTTFSFSRSAPSEYMLTLEKTDVDTSAVKTLIAPPNSGAIKSVRPVASTPNTVLRIFTDPSSTLEPKLMGNKLVISSVAAGLAENDMRAQAAPPATSGGEVKPTVEKLSSPTESQVSAILADTPKYTGRLISLDLQDTDIDNALRIIAEVSNLNIIASGDVTGKVTLRLIDVPWDQALDVILKTNGLDKVQDGNVIRIAPVDKLRQEREALKNAQQAEEELEPLKVRYIRVNYAKASELKPLVETIVSERGSVAYDERSNQIIVKDIQKGIVNVAELISKLDLRTPQVLLETQIVEAQRSLLRDLGVEMGFEYIQSPETGNATGMNFPNSIGIGGAIPGTNNVVSFPAAISASGGSAISALFGSADGSKSLNLTLSSLENEGRVRIVSRPSVATVNNKQAIIKSVEKIRIRLPNGGTSVATGQGASASSGNTVATEVVEVGITLQVTPQASPDYYVLLDIDAKSSTLGANAVDSIPSEVERSATSSVLVSSGQTFALGGIYKITDIDRANGVPFFKDIPFFGHLFRNTTVDNKDEEIIFFITPRIVEGSFDDAAMKMNS